MPTVIRVLILEDNPADAELMVEELRGGGFEPLWQRVETEPDYLAALSPRPAVILADYHLPQFDAPHALQLLQERSLAIPFIVVSGAVGEETAAAIVKQGADDYLLKDRMVRLAPAVVAALEKERLREENLVAEEAARRAEQRYRDIFENATEGIFQSTPPGQILTANPAMARMLGYSSPKEVMAEVQDTVGSLHVDPERRAELVRLLAQNGFAQGYECRFLRKDRTAMWVSMNGRVVRDSHGQVVHYNYSMVDITELRAASAALYRNQEELRDLAARLITAQETESKRLARELHDLFSQKLAVLGIELGLLRAKPPDSPSVLHERLTSVCDWITELTKGLHQTSRTLHPSIIEDLGLSEALKHECATFSEQHRIPVKASSRKLPDRIPDDVSLCLYRITQECLWNIRNHAKASEVQVNLRGGDGEIVLTVEDDGCGFVRDAVRGKGGLGLVSMQERVRLVSGKLSIESKPGGGTRVRARVPLP